ncbi:MAG: hypothetical protein U0326_41020 [Polyangiales bacterium]
MAIVAAGGARGLGLGVVGASVGGGAAMGLPPTEICSRRHAVAAAVCVAAGVENASGGGGGGSGSAAVREGCGAERATAGVAACGGGGCPGGCAGCGEACVRAYSTRSAAAPNAYDWSHADQHCWRVGADAFSS